MSQHPITEQEWFKLCPSGLIAQDHDGCILGANSALEKITGLSAAQLLASEQEESASIIHCLLDEDELIHMHSADNDHWLQRETSELDFPGGQITLHYYQDVTETQRLREEINRLQHHTQELTITDELTGLANKRALSQILEAQVTRSRRYKNPLSLALAEIVPSSNSTGKPPHLPDELLLTVSCYLRDRLRWADVLGRWDSNRFMLMLPETSEEDARTLIENISNGVADAIIIEGEQNSGFTLNFGLAEWTKGLDTRRLIKQVEQAVNSTETPLTS